MASERSHSPQEPSSVSPMAREIRRLTEANAALAESLKASQSANAADRESCRAALNVLKDAVDSQGRAEALNDALRHEITERNRVETALRESQSELADELRVASSLHALSTRCLFAPNLPDAARETIEAICALARASLGTVQLYDAAADRLEHVASLGFKASDLPSVLPTADDFRGAWGRLLRAGQRVTLSDLGTDPAAAGHRAAAAGLGFCSAYLIPLRAGGGKFVGIVTVYFSTPRANDEHELHLVDLFADQAARLIERRQAEEALRRAADANAYRVALGDVLRELRSPPEIKQRALRVLGENLGVDRALMVEPDGDGFVAIEGDFFAAGLGSWAGRHPVSRFGPTLLSDAGAGAPLALADIANDPRLTGPERAARLEAGVRSYVGIPLTAAGRTAAVLTVISGQPRSWSADEVARVAETAERLWSALEGTRTAAAMRASEEKYRTLFDAMDEGICVNELIYSDAGVPLDYRILQTNAAFERLSGVRQASGRTAREVFTPPDPIWLEIFARVARTGESLRFEGQIGGDGRWQSVFASRIGGEGSRRIAAVLNDITDRKRQDERIAFMSAISDEFAGLSTPDEIMQSVGAMVGRHLRLSFFHLLEINEDREEATQLHRWNRDGGPRFPRVVCLRDFMSDDVFRQARVGETVVVSDTAADPRTDAPSHTALKIAAYLAVPFLSEGSWKYFLVGGDAVPRDWRPDEVELFIEVGNRVFPRLERARAEAALRASEERSRALISNLPGAAAFVVDHDLRYQFAEGEALHAAGRSSRDFVGRTVFEALPPALAALYEPCFRKALQGEAFAIEHEARGRTFLSRGVPLRKAGGEVTGALCVAYDISERRAMEEQLLEREEQFRRAVEDAPIPVIMHAEDGQVLQISRTWTDLTGYSPKDVSTFDAWLNQAYGYGADAVRQHVEQVFSGGEVPPQTGFEIVTRSGERRYWVFSASAPGVLRDGRRFAVGMAVDLTERKRAEEALAASQEQLRLIVDSAHEYAILALDLERRVVSWNAGAERMLGYHRDEVIGQVADLLFVPEERAAGAPAREAAIALVKGRAEDERWHQRKDGTRFWASGVMLPMHARLGGAVIGFVKIFRDETEKREARQALEASREQLRLALAETERARAEAEAATKAKDHFIAVLSHELRTPLTPVLMAAHALARRTDLPEPVREALEMTRTNIQLEARLVDDLLDITRIARGKMEVIRGPMDMHLAIRQAVEVTQPDLEARRQRMVVKLDATEHHLDGDATRLKQVVWNLLKNASKFSPLEGEICLRTRNEKGRIIIEVSDCGIGIDPDALTRIFDSFVQADASITREFGGLGLGLSIAKASVEAHGGELRAQSAGRGHGATFTVSLPLAPEMPLEKIAAPTRNTGVSGVSVGAP